MAQAESVNVAGPNPNPGKPGLRTGIGKHPVAGPVQVVDPGEQPDGPGTGLVGDFIGDRRHHGGAEQAVYAFAREDLDAWQDTLGRDLPNGYFGENLTTRGLDLTGALVGERWRIGQRVLLQVSSPRIPCSTFQARMGEPGWVRSFTARGRPGAYLRVREPGAIRAGDPIEVVHRPAHAVTIGLMFRALTTERSLLPQLAAAGDDLPEETRELITATQPRAGG